LLKNVLYLGKVFHQDAVYEGEQAPIIEDAVWKRVQEKLAKERDRMLMAARVKASGMARRRSAVGAERAERVPRITRLLALALKFEELIGSGTLSNYAAVAQVAQVSRSRVTQMTSLLNLAPDIQEEILFLPSTEAKQLRISEPSLRKLTATLLWNQQREQWKALRRSVRPWSGRMQNRQYLREETDSMEVANGATGHSSPPSGTAKRIPRLPHPEASRTVFPTPFCAGFADF
jgi:hypothetical protein